MAAAQGLESSAANMIDESVLYLPVRQLAERIRTRQLSPVELAESYLACSERWNPRLNAYATLTRELAIEQARTVEKEIAAGNYRGPLHGIPYAAKDLLAAKGYPTTWGAPPYADQRFDYDATVIERLHRAGAVLIGKAAMIELAGGLGYESGYASLTGPCRNPWNTKYWTCGSSSGSGAIMAAGLAAFALGSDTRGSIICPATHCGISGMRPSFGRVSRYGAMAIAWSMDKIGPMCRTADDCGLVLEAMAGNDPRDHDSLPQPLAAFAYRGTQPSGRPLRIARLTNVFPHADPELHGAADRALRVLEQHGARISDAEIPHGPFEEAAELVILMEATSAFSDTIDSGRAAQLADPLGRINGYASREFSAQDYLHVQRVRLFLQESINKLFDRFDVISAPGEGDTADELQPAKGESEPAASGPVDSLQPDAISSLCGLPAVTVPCGLDRKGMPVGVQFLARALDDQAALSAANLFQAHTDWHTRHPTLT
jgi:aspartyl-tRNA(Asn)/glutamyl-tRNA(Gln) amidotransferase subunit A